MEGNNNLTDASLNRIFLALKFINRVFSIYSKSLEKDSRLTFDQLICLQILADLSYDGGLPMRDISKLVFVNPSTVTGVIDRLERKGLVRRVRSSDDRRIIKVVIAEAGHALLESIQVPIFKLLSSHLGKLTPGEFQAVAEGLDDLLGHIRSTRAVADFPAERPAVQGLAE